MTTPAPTVFVVDDDASVLTALERLLRSSGLGVTTFASPREFLSNYDRQAHGCIVLDEEMPEMTGLELQRAMSVEGNSLPVIFLTGKGDISMTVKAMRQGAVNFLTKPVDEQDLLDAVREAIANDRISWEARGEIVEINRRIATLTPREREVLGQVITGKLNKQTAAELGTGERTIKVHRGRVMEKLKVNSVAELVRLAERAGIKLPE